MAMKDWDFGYLGKGLEGYMHYKQIYDRSFGSNQSTPTLEEDDSDLEMDELQDEISDLQDELDDLQGQLADHEYDDTVVADDSDQSAVSFTISLDWGCEPEEPRKPLPAPPHPLPAGYDLTEHYWQEDAKYTFNDDLRRAMCDYFPEYKESYAKSEKSSNEILLEIFSVDKPLALKMWMWEMEHFQTALHDPEVGYALTTLSYTDPEVTEWIFLTQKRNDYLWRMLFGESTVIDDVHVVFMCYALENGNVDFFCYLMDFYEGNKSPRSDSFYSLDMLLEEILKEWYEDSSPQVINVMDRYIQKVEGSLRRAALQKRRQNTMPDQKDEPEHPQPETTSWHAPMTKERCTQIVLERHQSNPLPDEIKYVGVSYVAGLFAGDQVAIRELGETDTLVLVREANNPYDENAIRVDDRNSNKIGYIPKTENPLIAQLMDLKSCFGAKVVIPPNETDRNMWIEIYQIMDNNICTMGHESSYI